MKAAIIAATALLGLAGCGHNLAECRGSDYAANDPTAIPSVWDDGESTYLRFPGHSRLPSIFVVNPDGKEATANYSVSGDLVTLHKVAPMIKLRDGDAVACIRNNAYNPIGYDPGTGTTSPNVERVSMVPAP